MMTKELPRIIQGGMGIGVSSWQLARSVSRAGQLGVVSGTALDVVVARRLQDGDLGGSIRRALEHFPDPSMADRVLARYYKSAGRSSGQPYRPVPKLTLRQSRADQELTVVSNFVDVWLAKQGHHGVVGINYLEKVQMATPAAAFGAILADVDYVLMGAGVPREIPRLLTDLAHGRAGGVNVDVVGAAAEERHRVEVTPGDLFGVPLPALRRPTFLAIVSASVLAAYLARDEATRPDGFVVETPDAGGHNAPPRGRLVMDPTNQPVYGPRDQVDPAKMAALGIPFWLAGGYSTPDRVDQAVAAGAAGVQVGTLFALAEESGLTADLRTRMHDELARDTLTVRTDVRASPTGFPFKVAQLPGTLAEPPTYEARSRICDLGYLRTPYRTEHGDIGYRCPSEPTHMYVRKGGDVEATVDRQCLCNALTANIGLGQVRRDGSTEPALLTLGTDLDGARQLATRYPGGWTATEAIDWLNRTGPRSASAG